MVQGPAGAFLIDAGAGELALPFPVELATEHSPSHLALAGKLPAALAEAGVAPEDVTAVLLTHLHLDHVGWIWRTTSRSFRTLSSTTAPRTGRCWTATNPRGRSWRPRPRRASCVPTAPRTCPACASCPCRGTWSSSWPPPKGLGSSPRPRSRIVLAPAHLGDPSFGRIAPCGGWVQAR
ncbi:MBL fold metallo-hydrolase [Actinoplanes sp. NPDC000266]